MSLKFSKVTDSEIIKIFNEKSKKLSPDNEAVIFNKDQIVNGKSLSSILGDDFQYVFLVSASKVYLEPSAAGLNPGDVLIELHREELNDIPRLIKTKSIELFEKEFCK